MTQDAPAAQAAAKAPAQASAQASATRGRPVWMLVLLIAGWVLLRAATWQPGLPDLGRRLTDTARVTRASDAPGVMRASADTDLLAVEAPALPQDLRAGLSPEVADQVAHELPRELAHQLAIETAREMARAMAPGLAQRLLRERGLDRLVQPAARTAAAGYAAQIASAHATDRDQVRTLALGRRRGGSGGKRQTLAPQAPADRSDYQSFRLAAGHSAEPVGSESAPAPAGASGAEKPHRGSWLAMLPELLLHPGRARQALAQQAQAFNPGPRISADAWFLQRGGSAGIATSATPLVAGTPGYGGSQSGAVLRYRLFLQDPHRLSAFLRVSSAVSTPDREATLGLAARPVGSIPIVLQAEARLQSDGNGTRVRPAVQAVSQFPPIALPLGLRGEAYAAGGYVGGRGATPFYDAQGVIDHPLFRIGKAAELRIGGGAWAGGQKGVGRVDVGPRASVTFRLRRIGVRAAVEYRARVAGHAAPGSGPALTLSAGF